jgi:60 kDa SS-A/Ro ribonucleoprotein
MTSIGLVKPMSEASRLVASRLYDQDAIKKARIHPIQVLLALRTYEQGHGDKGSLSWSPVQPVAQALDKAFYLAFGNVVPTGKNILYALDVSGSMSWQASGLPITCSEVTAALSLVLASTEQNYHIMGFADMFRELPIRPGMSLKEACRAISDLSFGGTDCSLPFQWAAQNKVHVDGFVTMTDNETWAGGSHPVQELNKYRSQFVRDARSIVIGIAATDFTINDPNDALGLDVAGFDAGIPTLVSDFIRGEENPLDGKIGLDRRETARKARKTAVRKGLRKSK